MQQNLNDSLALLSRTPPALDALLRDLPGTWTLSNEGEGTWSAFDVVGHLINADRTNWLPRLRRILEFGESRPFEPFQRRAHLKTNQGRPLGELLGEFARVRRNSLEEVRGLNLSPEDFARRGQHPALGVATLSELLAAWVAHDLTHVHQISRIMAHQYREAVGPWKAYLGVMHCAGHGAP